VKQLGRATGTLAMKIGAGAFVSLPVNSVNERLGHDALECAKISSVRVKPYTPAELKAAYQAEAVRVAAQQLASFGEKRALELLLSAAKATTKQAMAADFVRCSVVAQSAPNGDAAKAFDEKLALPATAAVMLLIAP